MAFLEDDFFFNGEIALMNGGKIFWGNFSRKFSARIGRYHYGARFSGDLLQLRSRSSNDALVLRSPTVVKSAHAFSVVLTIKHRNFLPLIR